MVHSLLGIGREFLANEGTALTTDTSRIRLAGPHCAEMHLRQASKFVLEWLRLCFAQEQPLLSLVGAYIAQSQPISAADGFADPQWQSRDWTYEAGSQHSIGLLLVQSSFSVEEVSGCNAMPMDGWMDGWMEGWMDGTQGTAARKPSPPPSQGASAGALRQRSEVVDWPPHASIHEPLPDTHRRRSTHGSGPRTGRDHRGQ